MPVFVDLDVADTNGRREGRQLRSDLEFIDINRFKSGNKVELVSMPGDYPFAVRLVDDKRIDFEIKLSLSLTRKNANSLLIKYDAHVISESTNELFVPIIKIRIPPENVSKLKEEILNFEKMPLENLVRNRGFRIWLGGLGKYIAIDSLVSCCDADIVDSDRLHVEFKVSDANLKNLEQQVKNLDTVLFSLNPNE